MSLSETFDHGWWLASRSAGIVAYLLLSAAVVAGLAMALRLAAPRHTAVPHRARADRARGARRARRPRAPAARRRLPAAGPERDPRAVRDVIPAGLDGHRDPRRVPDARPLADYYARRRIGARRWRTAHRLIPVAWAMAVAHVIGSGSDAGSLWLQVPLALTLSAVLTLPGYRLLGGRAVAAPAPRRRPPVRPPAEAPTEPMAVAAVAADEAVTAVASPSGYRPLWARNPSPPPR